MDKVVTLEQVLNLAKQLSLVDKVSLNEQVARQIKRELQVAQPKPRKSLRGLWRGLDITEEDIAEARREMWGNFPREDI
ncbi:hypothetical protein H6F61_13760 [Cyanobacteria bacterium FACHB-472]|nr:hypothetical protein [Cyanobacteria bacterium FACHB-472]